ncbi:Uncharacterised protein [Mycobacteroides abscessus subsp. abscessus]|nr:Uncharacterised protein [Mycobacteroides abscessus subsp. abscessus]SKU19703.1 Uncharacterised protein [Mycobacteroides abscessus subsp. abscessus]
MIGIADQRDGRVAARREQADQVRGDLPMTTGDDDLLRHGVPFVSPRPTTPPVGSGIPGGESHKAHLLAANNLLLALAR